MGFDRNWRAIAICLALALCGAAASGAWRHGLWGLFTGTLLAVAWLSTHIWWATPHSRRESPAAGAATVPLSLPQRLLLDAAPTPMLSIEAGEVRALNRAARALFATDGRIAAAPPAIAVENARHLEHEGRVWRIDRVVLTEHERERTVAALIDIGEEQRVAEARATAELIHVLGHELLNGLAPIVSLAESGVAALDARAADPVIIRQILGTLARRAEALQRFTEAYRQLARLPEPSLVPAAIAEVASDLARLFAGRWPHIALRLTVEDIEPMAIDRDQVTQAVWALLQNAAEAAAESVGKTPSVTLNVRRGGGSAGAADRSLLIDVEDSGDGVPPARATHIFRPFHTTKPDGTGVGLSLARQIAHAHGGTLTLEPRRPTTFRLTLPGRTAAPLPGVG